jgi:hypothetical protein
MSWFEFVLNPKYSQVQKFMTHEVRNTFHFFLRTGKINRKKDIRQEKVI